MPHPQCGEWPDFDATNLRWLLEPADLHPPTFAVPGALWEPAGRPLYVCRQVRGYPPVTMRLVIARCSVDYRGRLTAHLPTATRLIMVKADGCVAIHADGGAYKPLNWMNAPNTLVEEEARWVVTNPKGEELTIRIEEVVSDHHFDLGQDPGLEKDGVEAHLQELLAAKPEVLEEGLVVVRREYPTDIGPVDLLCRSEDGDTVAVEIKRKGEMDGVEQLTRYLDRLGNDSRLHPLRGVLAATIIAPQAKVLAAARGISCVEVDYEQLRGAPSNHLRLF